MSEKTTEKGQGELARIVLVVLFIGGLIAASFWILRPFLGAIIWATMIVVSTWPLMRAVQKRLGGRRWAAVTVMSLVLLLVLIVPLSLAIGTIVANVDDIVAWAKRLSEFKLGAPPSWLAGLPVVGERAVTAWQNLAAQGAEGLAARIAPYTTTLVAWFVSEIGAFGALFIQFLLTVIAAAVLYAQGEAAADWVLRFGARLGGGHGERAVRLSGQAIRGVALGVVVTAFVQSLIGGIGLAVAGVPFAAVLTAVMFLLAVAQIGAVPVLIVPVIWLYWSGSPGLGHLPAPGHRVRGHPRQRAAPVPDQEGRGFAAAPHLPGRDRRPDCVRPDRHLRRPTGAGGDLHPAQRLAVQTSMIV